MIFVETPIFTAQLRELLADDEYSEFQKFLIRQPDAGDVIRGTGLNPGQPLVLSGNYQLDDGMSMRVESQDKKGAQ